MNGIYRIKIANGFNDRFTLSNCKHISDGWLIYEAVIERLLLKAYEALVAKDELVANEELKA